MPAEPVTIGIINFNGRDTVTRTLDSIKNLRYENVSEIIVADNNSTDGSPELIKSGYPGVKLLQFGRNRGSAYARNRILESAGTNMVFAIDNDITLTPDCLDRLVRAKKEVPLAAAVHPEIVDEDEPETPQIYNGGWIHYLCAFIPRKEFGTGRDYEIFDTVSGGALLLDRRISGEIGDFDEDYFFNWEDGDYTFRLTVSGYFCLNVPGAVVYHRSRARGRAKVFYQVRNRWYFVLKIYSPKTILLCIPAFLLYELSLAALMLLKGTFIQYLRGNARALLEVPRTLKKREKVQALKTRKDAELLRAGDIYVPGALLGGKVLSRARQIYAGIFSLYWRAVKRLLF